MAIEELNSPLAAEERCLQLRRILHELSNLTTGVLISTGLLTQFLRGDERQRYVENIADAGERSAALLREARALLHPEGNATVPEVAGLAGTESFR